MKTPPPRPIRPEITPVVNPIRIATTAIMRVLWPAVP
jgi:hypothetical protein